MTEQDIENAVEGWNTEGRIKGCGPVLEDGLHGHVLDCQCPPYTCHDCGTTQSQREPCGCFTSLEGMSLADLKAIFAAELPEFSLDIDLGEPRTRDEKESS